MTPSGDNVRASRLHWQTKHDLGVTPDVAQHSYPISRSGVPRAFRFLRVPETRSGRRRDEGDVAVCINEPHQGPAAGQWLRVSQRGGGPAARTEPAINN